MPHHHSSQASAIPPPSGRRSGGRPRSSPASFDAFTFTVYLPHIRHHKRSWHVDERIARQHISAIFGSRPLTDIRREEVEYWLHGLAARGLAPSTCNRILAVFKSICSLAIARGMLPPGFSPCLGVSSFKVHSLRERYLSHDEAKRLIWELEHSSRPEAVVIRLLLLTGARKSEILKARWEHVHLEQHLLTVPLSKSGKPRHITLSDEAVAIIQSLPRKPGCPWLFPGHAQDKPLSDIYVFWNRLRRKLGLEDVRIHDLRHSYASFLVNAGHSLYEVQRLLGHSDPRTTMRYAHLGQASLVEAAQTVSGYLAHLRRGGSNGRIQPRQGGYRQIRQSCRASPADTHVGGGY